MKRLFSILLALILLFAGCTTSSTPITYQQITQEQAKSMMESQDVIVLDVREQDEYETGHIAGAVLLPVGSITDESASSVIPALDTVILVYCRSGNRSKTASQKLIDLGYTAVYEFGGINTWPYEVE